MPLSLTSPNLGKGQERGIASPSSLFHLCAIEARRMILRHDLRHERGRAAGAAILAEDDFRIDVPPRLGENLRAGLLGLTLHEDFGIVVHARQRSVRTWASLSE